MTVADIAPAVPSTRLDILSEELAADPWPVLRSLREQAPILWHETYGRWIVTTDREIRKILSDHRRFTVEDTTVADLFGADAFISIDDRRRHDRLRNIWAEAFRVTGLARLRPEIAALVDRLLAPVVAQLRTGEAADLTAGICRSLPTMVIARMMGVADSMLDDVVRWSDAMAAGGTAYLDENEAVRLARQRARDDAKAALSDYLVDQMAFRRREPGDDLISALVNAEDAKGLEDGKLAQNLRQLLFAGNETTAKWLAQIFVVLGERPDVRRELVADPSLVPAANDEVLRWSGVVGTLTRRVRGGAIEMGGVTMAEGDNLTLLPASGNRDPARHDDPDRFDIHRPRVPSLGFGVGLHNCLGSMLAKMEAEVAVGAFLAQVPDFSIAAPYHYSTLPLRGPMPVIVKAVS